MEKVLAGLVTYLKSADTDKKFKDIVDSEFMDDMIKKNRMPFIDIIGMSVNKTPVPNMSMTTAYRMTFNIVIVICQDARVTQDIIRGTSRIESIWALSEYVYAKLEADPTCGGIVNRISQADVNTTLTTLTKDNTVKLALEMPISLIKDVFK